MVGVCVCINEKNAKRNRRYTYVDDPPARVQHARHQPPRHARRHGPHRRVRLVLLPLLRPRRVRRAPRLRQRGRVQLLLPCPRRRLPLGRGPLAAAAGDDGRLHGAVDERVQHGPEVGQNGLEEGGTRHPRSLLLLLLLLALC